MCINHDTKDYTQHRHNEGAEHTLQIDFAPPTPPPPPPPHAHTIPNKHQLSH